jgi:hypothetical protein
MGNEYGISPFSMMLQFLSPLFIIGPFVLSLWVTAPLFLYPIARWKANREGIHDPQLGLKVALHFFALLALQLVLLAAVIVIYTLFSKSGSSEKGELYRAGFALLIPAGAVLAAHLVLLKRTNEDQYPTVRRLFLGYNLLVTGLVGLFALIFAFQVFFQKGSAGDPGRAAIAGVLVYVGAWAAFGIQFGRLVFGDHGVAPPSNVMPPPAPSNIATQSSGPVLPSLSAGSFPPIDQK